MDGSSPTSTERPAFVMPVCRKVGEAGHQVSISAAIRLVQMERPTGRVSMSSQAVDEDWVKGMRAVRDRPGSLVVRSTTLMSSTPQPVTKTTM